MLSSSTSCLKTHIITYTTSITSHHQYIHIHLAGIESPCLNNCSEINTNIAPNRCDYSDFLLTWYQHSCDQCGKSYKTRKSLSRHRRFECRFTTERPIFQCPSCNYAAKRSDNLTKHIKTHFAKMQKEFLPLAVKMQNAIQSQLETV
ncbi:unnamed protein product [Ceratitis capitata]|uniref:(Mediterranean fruit fly) hypothetical protein n=1 Tax=Ceratitis capitata TaxID=7213 RepID=W8CEC1_CERCA|nr:unnamed protein product [Ceratitis capitata]